MYLIPLISYHRLMYNDLHACLCHYRLSQYQRMLTSLAQCEFSMGKTLLVYDMNLKEMENYEEIYADIGKASG